MSQMGKNVIKLVALGFAAAVMVGITEVVVEAAVGEVLWTVDIPSGVVGAVGAQCSNGSSGSAVAVVPGGKLSFPKFQTLLVTSCVEGSLVKLFFLDPSTVTGPNVSTAKLVATVDTILPLGLTLDAGWEALALRPDKVDLIGCGLMGGQPKIVSIDFNKISPNTTVDGTATLLYTGPLGSTCQGLAWDVTGNPKTIYQSSPNNLNPGPPPSNPSVLHLSEAGAPIAGSVGSGCQGSVTGVAVGVVSTETETPAFSGSVLFVACPKDPEDSDSTPEIRQIKRANGGLVTSVELPTGSFTLLTPDDIPIPHPGDIECDPVTFALSQNWHPTIRNKDVLWVKDTDAHKVYAMELPFAACGPVPPPPTPDMNACLTGDQDTDGDGLLDCWEDATRWADGLPGIALDGVYQTNRTATSTNRFMLCVDANANGVIEPLLGECADPLKRDVFVEIDYMEFHKPNPLAVSDVVAAFAGAPAFAPNSGKCNTAPTNGCTAGIRLHVQVDEQITHVDNTALPPCTGPKGGSDADFDAIKNGKQFPGKGFGAGSERANANILNAKRLAFHYGLWVHNQSPPQDSATSSSSGCAELFGNDFMVSMGSWAPPNPAIAAHPGGVGSRSEQAGTFMHELGHNHGLRHGGVDNTNCKPNHVSVMNYSYQFPNTVTDRPLNYSPVALGVAAPLQCNIPTVTAVGLNEGCLNETLGLGTLYTGKIVYGPLGGVPAKGTIVTAGGPINWDKDSNVNETSVSRDLTSLTSATGGCPPANPSTAREFLEGSNDWQLLQLNLRGSPDFFDGVSASFDPSLVAGTQDINVDDALDLSGDLIGVKKKSISVHSSAVVEVAILSREGVDATTIDPLSVTLRGLPPGAEWVLYVRRGDDCKVKDDNKDGRPDLVCKFDFQKDTLRTPGTQKAVLTGTNSDDYDFHGSDTVLFK